MTTKVPSTTAMATRSLTQAWRLTGEARRQALRQHVATYRVQTCQQRPR